MVRLDTKLMSKIHPNPNSPPVVLSVAGSDNSAGAGIQADLKTMSALEVYGVTAVTCVVAEIPGQVTAIHPVPPEVVSEQIRILFRGFPIAAIKTGMLHSAVTLNAVVDALLAGRAAAGRAIPLVVDPVMVATSGDSLMEKTALDGYRSRLFPLADLVTPNLDEVAVLLGSKVSERCQMREAGRSLVREFGTAFLMKGGHLGGEVAADLLVERDGSETWFEAPFVRGVSTHGTGCTYSAAIAARLGGGRSLRTAVAEAKEYLSGAIAGFARWQHGECAVDALSHFAPVRSVEASLEKGA
jgi:hydroxymethylpyrimidine/phosphomethylpyrimidine kinase